MSSTTDNVTSSDDKAPSVLSHTCASDYYYDALTHFDMMSTSVTSGAYNLIQNHTNITRKKLFCCFCPAGLTDDSDLSEDGDESNTLIDLAIDCNLNNEDVDDDLTMDPITSSRRSGKRFDMSSMEGKEGKDYFVSISKDRKGKDGIELSIGNEDDFLSCCDSEYLSLGESKFPKNQTTSRITATPRHVAAAPFSRYVRIADCSIHKYDKNISLMDIDNATEYTADVSLSPGSSYKTCTDENPAEVAVTATPTTTKTIGQSAFTKLTFLELTNKYDHDDKKDRTYHSTVIETMDKITRLGLNTTLYNVDENNNQLISWKPEGSTSKIIKNMQNQNDVEWYENSVSVQSLEKNTLVWSGSYIESSIIYGSKIPIFKGRGIIPSLSPLALTELLLDSSRVKLYNKYSNGRIDLGTLQHGVNTLDGVFGDGCSKLVRSETNIPLSSKKVTAEIFLHARPVQLHLDDLHTVKAGKKEGSSHNENESAKNSKAFILISRTIYTHEGMLEEKNRKDSTQAKFGSSNEVIWGLNILREVPGHPNSTDLTNIAQANSSIIPSFMSHKVGMLAVNEFFKNLRGMKI